MRFVHVFTLVTIWLAAAAGLTAQSQITTAVIDGTVVDTSGAVLPGVEDEIRNVDTNLTRTLTTDRNGRFVACSCRPAPTASPSSSPDSPRTCRKTCRERRRYRAAQPGDEGVGVAETVTVTTTSPAVETTRTTAASTLNERTIESTPILGASSKIS